MICSTWRAALLAMACLSLAGCVSRGGSIPYNPTSFSTPDTPPPAISAADYKLSPGDVVTVKVFELDSVSGDQTIDVTGHLKMALIGAVPADGLTTAQLGDRVSSLLQVKYLQSPHVLVTLKEAVQRTVTVDGAVDRPGVYAVPPSTSLMQAIALARGLSKDANPRRVAVFRTIGGQRRAAAFDLLTIRHGKDPDPAVYPNDMIVVDGATLAAQYRELLRSLPLVAFLGL